MLFFLGTDTNKGHLNQLPKSRLSHKEYQVSLVNKMLNLTIQLFRACFGLQNTPISPSYHLLVGDPQMG